MPRIGLYRAALLYLFTVAVFWRVSLCEFTNHDDPEYVYGNPHVVSGVSASNAAWAFGVLNGGISYWHPLTWLSHQVDCQLFGLNPGAHHLTNMWIHLANVMLVYVLLSAMGFGQNGAFVVASLFGIHPLRVESVAWISERKDVLYGWFWLLALYSYIRHRISERSRWYLSALGFFLCALMSKPAAVTLPLVLGLLELLWNGRNRGFAYSRWTVAKLAPFWLLSIGGAMITLKAQSDLGAVQPLAYFPFPERLDNAIVSLVTYLRKAVYPSDLCVSYVQMEPHAAHRVAAALAILFATSFAVWSVRRARPWLLCGWIWYVLTLIPNLGLVQAGAQSMADRYTYVPLLGVFVMWVELGREAVRITRWRRLLTGAGIAVVLVYGSVSCHQIESWKNGVTLFTRAVEVDERNWVAQLGLGMALTERGRYEEALPHLRRAVELPGNRAEARRKLAICLRAQARP